jgi:protein-disulfide isomerase
MHTDSPMTPETNSHGAAAPSSPARTRPGGWTVAVPMLCLVATLGFWWQVRSELAVIRAEQRELSTFIDAVTGGTLDISADPALGSDDAVVTLIEFSDYECPFCIRHFTQTMPEISKQMIETGRIQYVFRDFPIASIHPEAVAAHEATRCAAEQGLFWELHVRMFSAAGTHTPEAIEAHAEAVGIDMAPFRACLESDRMLSEIEDSVATAARLGANGTPAFFVGLRNPETNQVRLVQPISGAVPYSEFERVISAVEAMAAR